MRNIDGKFAAVVKQFTAWPNPRVVIINKVSGQEIPDDEPLFLLRARDHLAISLLIQYLRLAQEDGCNPLHLKGIQQVLGKFYAFAREHPDQMKQPGITHHLKLEGE